MRTLPHLNTTLTILFLAAFSFNASSGEKFKVCADPLNPPYSSKNGDGFENKIAELFAKELDQDIEYTWLPQRLGFIRNTLNAPLDNVTVLPVHLCAINRERPWLGRY